MIVITVSFGTTACPLLFKTEESAKAAWELLMPSFQADAGVGATLESLRNNVLPAISAHHTLVADDFGRNLYLTGQNFSGAVFEDLEISKEGQIEQALHQARTQAMAQQRGQADPKLSALSRMQGPAMIHPFGPGNGRM